ncbi:4-phosphoerythronate dehydrogenase [Agrilactobacillus composti DSM 18527 = JCM 14202]|uniref:D-3-phosphoglycerate dehydrogenase n=1 Tax=Agrilactobacillus composti DSM 18527 = JCM 14202 TaxID=1423734 RepID=X0QSU3_9LACO|nr:3-phosphoglycerate dehydrogenase family protein [Agrilactobacillus composti]KRM32693.1 4-phosphoerythronate dehydrogenase [Agrilactobacillus composti DSM 18527 = JCM 14202]GAF41675.1 D-3-phosphoglycerate dehydrogenase [Agrilactobacillus composti DSM 18527 = JCM 14202]
MYNIKTFNAIAPQGLAEFSDDYLINESADPDAYLIRSVDLHEHVFPENLKAIARCGAGFNNIPLDKALENGTVAFNTPGGNANAVKELIIANMIICNRNIIDAANWAAKAASGADITLRTEKEKTAFNGVELMGKRLTVIGLGHVGSLVANAGLDLGMRVTGYDPYLSADAAWHISDKVKRARTLEDAIAKADFVTVHVPKNEETIGLINADVIQAMKPKAVLLNFSRLGIVDNAAAVQFLQKGTLRKYITDFSSDELIGQDNVILMPHIGGSTVEAEINCARIAAQEVQTFLETGNIENSVNMPNIISPFQSQYRFTLIHKNVPNMLGQISTIIAGEGVNIENLANRAKDGFAYTMVDANDMSQDQQYYLLDKLKQIPTVTRVRLIKAS